MDVKELSIRRIGVNTAIVWSQLDHKRTAVWCKKNAVSKNRYLHLLVQIFQSFTLNAGFSLVSRTTMAPLFYYNRPSRNTMAPFFYYNRPIVLLKLSGLS